MKNKISNFIKGSIIIISGMSIPVIYHTEKEKYNKKF